MAFVSNRYTKVAEVLVASPASGAAYCAFPGLVQAANGDLLCAYMRATDHATTRDGSIRYKRSTDNGDTWGAEGTIADTADDLRDADLVRLANDAIVCTYTRYFGGDHESYVATSSDNGVTWGTPVLITSRFDSWSFVSGRAVQLPGGALLVGDYGRSSTDTRDRAGVSRSLDNGATWSTLAAIDSGTFGRAAQEPYLAYDTARARVWCAMRSDGAENRIYLFHSDDDGATWVEPSTAILTAASGRPALLFTPEDALALAYRDSADSDRGKIRWSFDGGASWSNPQSLNSSQKYAYASWCALDDGTLGLAWGVELSATDADVVFQRMTPPARRKVTLPRSGAAGAWSIGATRSGSLGL